MAGACRGEPGRAVGITVTNAAVPRTSGTKGSAVAAELLDVAPSLVDVGSVVAFLADALLRAGVPVARITTHVRTLHPDYLAVMRIWRRDRDGIEQVRPIRPGQGRNVTAGYHSSPFAFVRETGQWLERRLSAEASLESSTYKALRQDGLTHYIMAPLLFSNDTVNAMSWATDEPHGFSDADRAVFREVVPTVRAVIEAKALRRIAGELLGAYVGTEPATRILSGTVRRGDVTTVEAAILLADLRDFSGLSQQLAPAELVPLLNIYLDCVIPIVIRQGGEVLKIIGDGVLAIFRSRGDIAAAAIAALAAARDIVTAVSKLEQMRPDGSPLQVGIGLHAGEVAYGNVGGGGRLDFTVIGDAVNLANRIEGLCGPLGRSILLTEAVARLVVEPLDDVGRHLLKGVGKPVQVFALREPDEH